MARSLAANSLLELAADAEKVLALNRIAPTTGPTVDRLKQRISYLEEQNQALRVLNQDLQLHLEHLAKQALIDPLTGLANRRYLDSTLDKHLSLAGETGEPLALILCDVDRFKHYNDTFGHSQGDTVLVRIGALLRRFCRREGDCAARYGGEEFALLLPGLCGREAVLVAESLRKSIAALSIARQTSPVTVSLGVTSLNGQVVKGRKQLIEAADRALYRAKRSGRNRTKYQRIRPA